MQKLAIILCVYNLDRTPHCAQTMYRTHSYILSFPLWHHLEVLDTSHTDLAGLCARWKQHLTEMLYIYARLILVS